MLAVTQPTGLSAISINDQNSLEQHYSTTNMDLFMADKYITGLYNQITQGYIHTTGLVEEGGELNFVGIDYCFRRLDRIEPNFKLQKNFDDFSLSSRKTPATARSSAFFFLLRG